MGLSPVRALLAEAWRRAHLMWWRWAQAELPHTLGSHDPAMCEIVLAIDRLEKPARRMK